MSSKRWPSFSLGAGEPADDALDETVEEALQGFRIGRGDAMELRSIRPLGIHPVQYQHVQMNVEIECAAKPLDEGDDTGSGDAAGGKACPMGQIGLDGADDDGQTTTERVGVPGEEQTQRPGETQHPLAYRYFREDMVNEVSRRFDHSTCATGRAKAATLRVSTVQSTTRW